ncbi:GNAT family N-acetyltransferase [Enterobacter sp. RHBSTW-00994]|nr:GNAT family N-acetyltransferase [Lelliottia sp. RWM.1]QLR45528.1 GNAT family N-acetyltransferase [Enterobacter sp. RHBSTW-00994]
MTSCTKGNTLIMVNHVSLRTAENDRHIIENLFRYYVYDLAEYGKWRCGQDGQYLFNSSLLDPHWSRDDHWPYLIYDEDELAGFCLLRRYPFDVRTYDVDQFFVLRKFKGMGVGKEAFRLAVTERPGYWQTRVMLENTAALRFWRSAIASVSGGEFREVIRKDDDLDMHFITYQIK